MKPKLFKQSARWAALCLAGFAYPHAWAAYSCTVTGSSLNVRYVQGTTVDATGQINFLCSRASGDAASTTYSVGIDTGEPPNGRQYTRTGGTQTLNYNIYRTSTNYANNNTWNQGNRRVTGNINFGTSLTTSFSLPYYLRIASQTGKPAGTYDDTAVGFNIRIPATSGNIGAGTVAFYAVIDPVCSISTPPSNITLNYTAFSASPVVANTNFSVNCTNQTPYTMSLNANNGTISGILYNLSLSSTSVNPTGAAQAHSIIATAPAGQAGTCTGATCSGSQARTLTITY